MVTYKILKCAASAFQYFRSDWQFLGLVGYFADDRAEDRRERVRRRRETGWFGAGAAALGLRGPVKPGPFGALLEGRLPGTPIRLGRPRRDAPPRAAAGPRRRRAPATPESDPATLWQHTPGLDLTFSPPKSFSVEALVSASRRMRARLLRADREAVEATLAFVDRELLRTRAQVAGTRRQRRVPAHGMVAARFQHLTSRDLDPQRHTHVVILNAVRDAAGNWRSLDFTLLRRSLLLVGAVYRTELQRRIEALGYATAPTRVGRMPGFEIAGYPPELLRHFSQRRQAVLAWIREKGLHYSPRVAQIATLATRRGKREPSRADLEALWAARAADLGITRDWEHARGRRGPPRGSAPPALELARRAVDHCAERATVFSASLVRGWALAHAGGRHSLAAVDGALRALERERVLVPLERTGVGAAYTTRRALAAERALLRRMRGGVDAGAPLTDPGRVEARLAASRLTAGQAEAARLVLASRHRVVGVQGHAGSGKTAMLRLVTELAGRRPRLALAPSAAATRILAAETGLPARTVQKFLVRYRAIGGGAADPAALAAARTELEGGLLIIDEASMIGTEAMRSLLRIAERARLARVALVGDRRQLAAVAAGQPFRLLQDAGLPSARMDEVLRQRNRDLKAVVAALVAREPGRAIANLGADVIEVGDDAGETTGEAAARLWLALAPDARAGTAIVAPTHAERAEISAAIRAGLADEGVLRGRTLEIDRYVNLHLTPAEKAEPASYRPGDVTVFHGGLVNYRIRAGDACVVRGVDGGRVELGHPDGSPRHIRPAGQIRYRFELYEARPIALRVGDRVRWTRNYRRGALELDNGATATITGIDRNRVRFRADGGPAYSLARGSPQLHHLDHAYATTVYGAQGMTCDSVIAVLDAGRGAAPDLAAFYVQITRARDSAVLLTDDREGLIEALEARTGEERSALEAVGAPLAPAVPPPAPKPPASAALAVWQRFADDARRRGLHPFAAPGRAAALAPILACAGRAAPGTPPAVRRVAAEYRAWSAARDRLAASRAALGALDARLAERLRAHAERWTKDRRGRLAALQQAAVAARRRRLQVARQRLRAAKARLAESLCALAERWIADQRGRLAALQRAAVAARRRRLQVARQRLRAGNARLAEGLCALAERRTVDQRGRLAALLRAAAAAWRRRLQAGGQRLRAADRYLAEGLRAHAEQWTADCTARLAALERAAPDRSQLFEKTWYQPLVDDVTGLRRARAALGEALAPGPLLDFLEQDARWREAQRRIRAFQHARVADWVAMRVHLERQAVRDQAASIMELGHYRRCAELGQTLEADGRALQEDADSAALLAADPDLLAWVRATVDSLAATRKYDRDAHALARRHRALAGSAAGPGVRLAPRAGYPALIEAALELAARPVALPPRPPDWDPAAGRADTAAAAPLPNPWQVSFAPAPSPPEPWPGNRQLDQRCNFNWLYRVVRAEVLPELTASADACIPGLDALAEWRREMIPEAAACGRPLPSLPEYIAWQYDATRELAAAGRVAQRARTIADALGPLPAPPPRTGETRHRDAAAELRGAIHLLQRALAVDDRTTRLWGRLVVLAADAVAGGGSPFRGAAYERISAAAADHVRAAEPDEVPPALAQLAEHPDDQLRVHRAIRRLHADALRQVRALWATRETLREEVARGTSGAGVAQHRDYGDWLVHARAALPQVDRPLTGDPRHALHWAVLDRIEGRSNLQEQGAKAVDAVERAAAFDGEVLGLLATDPRVARPFAAPAGASPGPVRPGVLERCRHCRDVIEALAERARPGELPATMRTWARDFSQWEADTVEIGRALTALRAGYRDQRQLIKELDHDNPYTNFADQYPAQHRHWMEIMAGVWEAVEACHRIEARYRDRHGVAPDWPLDREPAYWTCKRMMEITPDLDQRPWSMLRQLQDEIAAIPPGDANWYTSEACDRVTSGGYKAWGDPRDVSDPWEPPKVERGEEPQWQQDLQAARGLFMLHAAIRKDLQRLASAGPERWLGDDPDLERDTFARSDQARRLSWHHADYARLRDRFPDVIQQFDRDRASHRDALELVRVRAERAEPRRQVEQQPERARRARSVDGPSRNRTLGPEPRSPGGLDFGGPRVGGPDIGGPDGYGM